MSDAGNRRDQILARLADGRLSELGTKRLCQVCAEVTDMTGAGIMLMSGDTNQGSVCGPWPPRIQPSLPSTAGH